LAPENPELTGLKVDQLKEHYNEHYDTVVDELNKFYKKRLLELPEKLDGFYLDSDSNKITKADTFWHLKTPN
jgi:hypothetical protein